MNALNKLYYLLTTYIPRKLPTTPLEYARFKDILVDAYGVQNDPIAWITVAGQVTSTQTNKLRKSYGAIANAAKRLEINKLASEHRSEEYAALNKRLEEGMKELSEQATAECLDIVEVIEVPEVH